MCYGRRRASGFRNGDPKLTRREVTQGGLKPGTVYSSRPDCHGVVSLEANMYQGVCIFQTCVFGRALVGCSTEGGRSGGVFRTRWPPVEERSNARRVAIGTTALLYHNRFRPAHAFLGTKCLELVWEYAFSGKREDRFFSFARIDPARRD